MFETITLSMLWRLAAAVALAIGSIELTRRTLRFRRAKIEARASLIEPWTHARLAALQHGLGETDDTHRNVVLTAEQRQFLRSVSKIGIRAPHVPAVFMATRVVVMVCLAGLGWFLAPYLISVAAMPIFPALLAGVMGVLGWYLPVIASRGAARRRATIIVAGLPDALELLVICAEGGLSLGNGIDRVVKQLERTQPALADELALTAADLKILPDQDQALMRLAARVDAPIVQSVVTTLVQTMRYGTPFAQAIRSMAAEIRNDNLLQLEERANALPTIMTIPLVMFILPTIILIVGGPAALKLMDMFSN
jgi:tight adherence protein C